ncbi:MAG: FAD-binding oxidoreductase [Pseudomonadota bacterium]
MSAAGQQGGNSSLGYDESWYYSSLGGVDDYPTFSGELDVDVCVIGAGYTGLSAAIELTDKGHSVAVLEAHKIGAGASGRNGGVLGMGQRKDQFELESWVGKEKAQQFWQIACDANQLVRDRVEQHQIDCDLRDGSLTVAHRQRYERELWDYVDHLEANYAYTGKRKVGTDEVRAMLGVDSYFGGYVDSNAAHLHPLKLARGLARVAAKQGAKVFEDSAALGYEEVGDSIVVQTRSGRARCQYLILACNGYLGRFEKAAAVYQMPINNFILATEPLGAERGKRVNRDNVAVVDTRFVVNYFHNSPDHRLIFGGGENYSSRFPKDLKGFVRSKMLEVYPDLHDVKIDYAWGGTLAITLKRMPHFGRKGNRVYWAQGYSGHGIAMANMGGKLVAEAIHQQSDGFELFAGLKHQAFPGGTLLRWPGLVAGMLYYSMLDKF